VALATRESRLGITASWVSLLGSFVLSFATWVALGQLTGYGKLAFCLALCVDGYIVSALVTWMAPVSDKIATVAKVNTWIAAVIGVTAQSAYHGLTIWTQTGIALARGTGHRGRCPAPARCGRQRAHAGHGPAQQSPARGTSATGPGHEDGGRDSASDPRGADRTGTGVNVNRTGHPGTTGLRRHHP
jgi:hypothetical protein